MKTKLSKKLLSVLLAALLAVSTLPFASSTALAAASDTAIADLYSSITDFQKMFPGGTTYTNMQAGYDAYIAAYKLYDAAKYGSNNVTTAQLTSAKTTLDTAMSNMDIWLPVATLSKPTYTIANENVPDSNVGGTLYRSTPEFFGGYSGDSAYNVILHWVMPRYGVFLKGADKVKVPVMMAMQNNQGLAGNSRGLWSCFLNDNTGTLADCAHFQLEKPWAGHYVKQLNNSGCGETKGLDRAEEFCTWSQAINYEGEEAADLIPGYNVAQDALTSVTNCGAAEGTNNDYKYWFYTNYITYVGSDLAFNNGLQTSTFSWTGHSYALKWGIDIFSSDALEGQKYQYYYSGSSNSAAAWSGTYYVIDYSGVGPAIGSAAALLNFEYDYDTDTAGKFYLNHELDDLITKITYLQQNPETGFANDTNGFTDSNYASRAATVAANIQTGISNLATLTQAGAPVDQAAGFQTLRNKMFMTDSNMPTKGNAKEVYTAGNSNPQIWKASTYNSFSTAYSTARGIFDTLATSSGVYSSAKASQAASQAATVETTYLALQALADFSPIDAAVQAVHTQAQAKKGTDFRYSAAVLQAVAAALNNSTTFPYMHKTAAERITYEANANAAIAAEAAQIEALANTLVLDDQIDLDALDDAVDYATQTVSQADPDVYVGIDEAKTALAAYNRGVYLTNVTLPGTCNVESISPEASSYDQTRLDNEIAPLVALQNRQYDVYLNGSKVGTYPYGSTVTLNAPNNEANTSWEYSCKSYSSSEDVKPSIINGQSSVSLVVMGALTVNTRSQVAAESVKVTYKTNFGKVFAVDYVEPNSTVNPTNVKAPNYVGYKFTGYETGSFQATEDTLVVADYDVVLSDTYEIGFVNAIGTGDFSNPTSTLTTPFNTRMNFSEELFQDGYEEGEDDYGNYWVALIFNQGGDFKSDDYTAITEPTPTIIPGAVGDETLENWSGLYAISMVPEENYERWQTRKVDGQWTGRSRAVIYDKNTGLYTYNTEAAPNTEILLGIGNNLDYVWYAQQNCNLVFYTQEQFQHAVRANVFEGINTDATLSNIVTTHAYSKTSRITDSTNGEKNKIAFRGSVVSGTSATVVETGYLFAFKKNASAADRTAIAGAELDVQNAGKPVADGSTIKVTRVKVSDANLTRHDPICEQTGHQFALNFATKASAYTSGTTLDIKYRTYTIYKIGNSNTLYTIYSDEVTPDTFNF